MRFVPTLMAIVACELYVAFDTMADRDWRLSAATVNISAVGLIAAGMNFVVCTTPQLSEKPPNFESFFGDFSSLRLDFCLRRLYTVSCGVLAEPGLSHLVANEKGSKKPPMVRIHHTPFGWAATGVANCLENSRGSKSPCRFDSFPIRFLFSLW